MKITGLCLNLLISLLFIQKGERKKDPGHLEGQREGELLCACPADSLPDQPVLSHRHTTNFAAQPEEPVGFPSAPKLLRSGEAGRCTEGFYFQEISADTIVLQRAAWALPVPAQCIPSSLFHSLPRGTLVFRSLCSHRLETTQMSCKSSCSAKTLS